MVRVVFMACRRSQQQTNDRARWNVYLPALFQHPLFAQPCLQPSRPCQRVCVKQSVAGCAAQVMHHDMVQQVAPRWHPRPSTSAVCCTFVWAQVRV